MVKPSFEVSQDVAQIVDHLLKNDRADYGVLSAVSRRKELQGSQRYVLTSALRILERQHNRLFVCERGVGVTLATNGQRATLSTTHPISKIRRVTRRAEKRQVSVNVQQLTPDERLAFDVGRSVLLAIRNNTSQSLKTQLAKAIAQQDGGLVNISSVLALPRHRKKP